MKGESLCKGLVQQGFECDTSRKTIYKGMANENSFFCFVSIPWHDGLVRGK